jgi:predicted dithiol-disulfide oxidoreductase (DUF899 family)
MTEHAKGTREEWLAARVALLADEKELTRRSDELARKRPRRAPWPERVRDRGRRRYHTYSTYDRGTDALNLTWQLLDRTSQGRGGDPEGWPRRHDEYE